MTTDNDRAQAHIENTARQIATDEAVLGIDPTNDKVDQSGADERISKEIDAWERYKGQQTDWNIDDEALFIDGYRAALQAQPSAPANPNAVPVADVREYTYAGIAKNGVSLEVVLRDNHGLKDGDPLYANATNQGAMSYVIVKGEPHHFLGAHISVDVSTGDNDAGHRIFATVEDLQQEGDDYIFLAVEQSRNFATPAKMPASDAVNRPDIIEKLTYHKYERDDLTLDEALDYLAKGWKSVHGRTERQLIFQIVALLAAAPKECATVPQVVQAPTDEQQVPRFAKAIRKTFNITDAALDDDDIAAKYGRYYQGWLLAIANQDCAPQQPVAHQFYQGGQWHNFLNERHHLETVKAGYPVRALYAHAAASADVAAVRDAALEEGIEKAAKLIELKVQDFVDDNGIYDRDTGAVEFPGDGEIYVGQMTELAEDIRALKSAAPTAQPQAKPCQHIYHAVAIDGSNLATRAVKAVCMHCGYEPEPQADGVVK